MSHQGTLSIFPLNPSSSLVISTQYSLHFDCFCQKKALLTLKSTANHRLPILNMVRSEGPYMSRGGTGYNKQISLPMEYINTRPLTYLVHRIQHSSRVASVFNELNESCHLGLKFECPETVLITAKRINEREVHEKNYRPSAERRIYKWVFGEFKIFIWVVVYKCLINGLQVQQLSLEIIKEIQNIFKSKTLCFIQYEVQLLINQKYDLVSEIWEDEEVLAFSEIMSHAAKGKINWRTVSFELYQASGGRYFRNIHHCREKWFNHMNPIVKKGEWTIQEDILIFNLIKEHGLRWSMISRAMGKIRTEHMVKNRFNRYFRQWKLAKDASVDTIYKCFIDRIYKPYFRRHKKIESLLEKKLIKVEDYDGSIEQLINSTFNRRRQDHQQMENQEAEIQEEEGLLEKSEEGELEQNEVHIIEVSSKNLNHASLDKNQHRHQSFDEAERIKVNLQAIREFYNDERNHAQNYPKTIIHHQKVQQHSQTIKNVQEQPSHSDDKEHFSSSKAVSKQAEVKIEVEQVNQPQQGIRENGWNYFPFMNMYYPPPYAFPFPILF